MTREEVRQEAHRHFAVLEHVRYARRRAGVILEDVEFLVVHPHDVDAGDVDPDVVRRAPADHFRPIKRVAQDQFVRDDLLPEDRARPVHVLEEEVERICPLGEAGLELAPFGARDEARNDVEGNEPFGGVLVAVDAKGDADPAEHEFGLGAARGEEFGRCLAEPACDLVIERPGRTAGNPHLVERRHSACPNPIAGAVRPVRRAASVIHQSQLPCRCRERGSAPRRPASRPSPARRRNCPRSAKHRPAAAETPRAKSRPRQGSPGARSRIARRAAGNLRA